jgi:uncharacterized protein YlaI
MRVCSMDAVPFKSKIENRKSPEGIPLAKNLKSLPLRAFLCSRCLRGFLLRTTARLTGSSSGQ